MRLHSTFLTVQCAHSVLNLLKSGETECNGLKRSEKLTL